MVYNNQLVCYYSDERDPAHNQKLVYVTTTDLKNWSAIQPAVIMSQQNARPGMATVSKIPNGWIVSYELCNDPSGRSGLAFLKRASACHADVQADAPYTTESLPARLASKTPRPSSSKPLTDMSSRVPHTMFGPPSAPRRVRPRTAPSSSTVPAAATCSSTETSETRTPGRDCLRPQPLRTLAALASDSIRKTLSLLVEVSSMATGPPTK